MTCLSIGSSTSPGLVPDMDCSSPINRFLEGDPAGWDQGDWEQWIAAVARLFEGFTPPAVDALGALVMSTAAKTADPDMLFPQVPVDLALGHIDAWAAILLTAERLGYIAVRPSGTVLMLPDRLSTAVGELELADRYAADGCLLDEDATVVKIAGNVMRRFPMPNPTDLGGLANDAVWDGPSDDDTGPLPVVLSPGQALQVVAEWVREHRGVLGSWVVRPGAPGGGPFPSSSVMFAPRWEDVEDGVVAAAIADGCEASTVTTVRALARWSALPPRWHTRGLFTPPEDLAIKIGLWVTESVQTGVGVALPVADVSGEPLNLVRALLAQLARCDRPGLAEYVDRLLVDHSSPPLPAGALTARDG